MWEMPRIGVHGPSIMVALLTVQCGMFNGRLIIFRLGLAGATVPDWELIMTPFPLTRYMGPL